MNETSRRKQRVVIPSDSIEDYFAGNMAIIEGLPDDIELVRTWEDPARMEFSFVFRSENFPVVEEGAEIPVANIVTAQRRVNNTMYWVCPNCHETHENGDLVQ